MDKLVKMIVDAKDLVVGRFATEVAKKALLGEEVMVVNCSEAVMTGTRKKIVADFVRKREMGIPAKGPFFHRRSDMLVKRMIRGMLPYKQKKGEEAFKRIKCHVNVPSELEGKEFKTFEKANVSKLPNLKFMRVKEVCKILGAKE